jgi:hypothetical protein
MRRKISIIGVLLLALCVSGWSSALAAAFSCSHAKAEQPRAMMAQDHSCCHARLAPKAHCSTPEHEAMGDMQTMPGEVADAATTTEAAGQPAEPCAHCMERSEIPATPNALQVDQSKRGADASVSHKQTPFVPLSDSFTPQILAGRGSPPGVRSRKHLLIGVFII